MALSNYGELKSAIENWQYGAGTITANVADIVTLSQGYLNRRLRTRNMITQVSLSPTSGLFTLPSDYLQIRAVVEEDTYRRPLRYVAPEKADELYPTRPSGEGLYYTIIGSSIRVYPTISNDIELTYYAALGAFADDSATDWLLTKMPNLYLSAGQMFAAEFLKDDSEVAKQATIVDMYVSMLNAEDDGAELATASYMAEGFTP